ncbi:MAG: DUF4149 domain-containing protein [Pyrinomonadaceae bacterium]|nr:DUF4149 domain-containing protein [Pyrinomonadaceae bacterium]
MKYLSGLRALLMGLWLGGACFFSFAVAPSAFSVLAERELAGNLVSRTLMIVNFSGIAIGVLIIALSFLASSSIKAWKIWTERFLVLVTVIACAIGQFVITSWLSLIRAQAGVPMEQLAGDNPLKMQFDNLHQYSVWVLSAAMIAALIAFFAAYLNGFGAAAEKRSDGFDFQNEFIN